MAELLFGDSERSMDLFAAVGVAIGDPFLFVDDGGRRSALVGSLDHGTLRPVNPDLALADPRAHGTRELIEGGMTRTRAGFEAARRYLEELGVSAAVVSWDFPVGLADVLRSGGISVEVDPSAFERRRRVKTPAQLEGIRRAQAAADAAMGVGARMVRACEPGLTAETVRAAMRATAGEFGSFLGEDAIVAVNGQAAAGHDSGSGPIAAGDGVLIDIWPRDTASRCYADMTRTFVAGGEAPGLELTELWSLCKDALDLVVAAVRPGVHGRELHDIASAVFEAAGKPTQRSAGPGEVVTEGFFHGLGHGVGLDVHEAPGLGLAGDTLVAGDVIAVEPGCYRSGYGGVRLEDLLLVTDDGCEVLTQFPYDL